jgi:hypothetical protein
MCKNENPSFTTGHLAWEECKNAHMLRGHKTIRAKGQCGALLSSPPNYLRIALGVSLPNTCTYTALPNDEVSGSCQCQLRHRRIICSIQSPPIICASLSNCWRSLIPHTRGHLALATLTPWKITGLTHASSPGSSSPDPAGNVIHIPDWLAPIVGRAVKRSLPESVP